MSTGDAGNNWNAYVDWQSASQKTASAWTAELIRIQPIENDSGLGEIVDSGSYHLVITDGDTTPCPNIPQISVPNIVR